MFVAGEPGTGVDPFQDVETSVLRRMSGSVVGGWLSHLGGSAPAPAGSDAFQQPGAQPWSLPVLQAQCVRLVLDIARSVRKTVEIVDVNRPIGSEALVEQWVGPDRTLPVLVRADGARLQGPEEFVPRTVRRFMLGK